MRKKVRIFFAATGSTILSNIIEQSLGITNGRFGEAHVDNGDTPTHLSCATVLSDLPDQPGWEPGRMHFPGIGCYTVLSRL